MKTIVLALLAAAAAFLLHLSGPNEPDWLPYTVFLLLISTICLLGVCLADLTDFKNDPVRPEFDEHRDNAV